MTEVKFSGQVSDGCVLLLAFNGMTRRGAAFVQYINKYGLLEHMHGTYKQRWENALRLFYPEHAFLGSKERAALAPTEMQASNEQLRRSIEAFIASR